MTITGDLNLFNTSTLKQVTGKFKTFLKKLEYHFLVESATIESATFPYKTVLSNWMWNTKWNYHKERSFATNLSFWKFNLSIETSYKFLMCQLSEYRINTFCKGLSFNWVCFPCEYSQVDFNHPEKSYQGTSENSFLMIWGELKLINLLKFAKY